MKNGYNLTELRTDVLLYIAENGPTSINAVSKEIGKSYKSTYETVKYLEKHEFITSREYTNNPKWWVTDLGAKMALINDVDVDKMRKHSEGFYQNNEEKLSDMGLVFDMEMFPKAAIQAEMAVRKGDLENLGQFIEAAYEAARIMPEYLENHPDLAEKIENDPLAKHLFEFVIQMGKYSEKK